MSRSKVTLQIYCKHRKRSFFIFLNFYILEQWPISIASVLMNDFSHFPIPLFFANIFSSVLFSLLSTLTQFSHSSATWNKEFIGPHLPWNRFLEISNFNKMAFLPCVSLSLSFWYTTEFIICLRRVHQHDPLNRFLLNAVAYTFTRIYSHLTRNVAVISMETQWNNVLLWIIPDTLNI